jgi:succinoglycan biosynthesis protein ExoM
MIKLPHISVCICTYKRPELLKSLLKHLGRQKTDGLFTYSIVVADNDSLQSANAVVSDFAALSTASVTYCVQHCRNIALTRNHAVENATGDFVAFIDDDEFPTDQWLLTLFNACRDHAVDGVLGPVIPYFDKGAPKWIVRSGLFDRPVHPTGMRLAWSQTRTGNVLLKSHLFKDKAHRFNPEFLSGSDQEFFKSMIKTGRTFIWCNEAVVYEVVPPARWKRSFLIRRAVFRGVFSFHNRPNSLGPILWSLMAAPGYMFTLPFVLLLGQAKFMSYMFKLSYHIGRLLAVFGINPIKEPYVSD